jgi:CDP-paratose 2-epimerase
MKCTVAGEPYTVFGYGGKQVRDNIHSADVVSAFAEFHANPRVAAVYNLGGGRASNCSMLEAIELCEQIAERALDWQLSDQARMGDHRWWISDLSEFQRDYSDWEQEHNLTGMMREIHDQNVDRWLAAQEARS